MLYGNFVSLNVLIYGFIGYNDDVVGIMKMFFNVIVELVDSRDRLFKNIGWKWFIYYISVIKLSVFYRSRILKIFIFFKSFLCV